MSVTPERRAVIIAHVQALFFAFFPSFFVINWIRGCKQSQYIVRNKTLSRHHQPAQRLHLQHKVPSMVSSLLALNLKHLETKTNKNNKKTQKQQNKTEKNMTCNRIKPQTKKPTQNKLNKNSNKLFHKDAQREKYQAKINVPNLIQAFPWSPVDSMGVGRTGFGPATFCTSSRCPNQARRPAHKCLFFTVFSYLGASSFRL